MELKQDCVFFDPPWGGPGYKNNKSLDLFLGERNVVDVIIELFENNKVKYVVLKAPTNFNETKLLNTLNLDKKYNMLKYDEKKRRNYITYFVYYINGLKSLEFNKDKKDPYFPYLSKKITDEKLKELVNKIIKDDINVSETSGEFKYVFSINSDETGDISRVIQEEEILKTKLMLGNKQLFSFWDVWKDPSKGPRLKKDVLNSKDPYEEIWKLTKKYSYKIATTFMPLYAKAIYKHFNASKVLDPCAGWGDRLIGAAASKCVKTYIGFDPNIRLRNGYAQEMKLFGHDLASLNDKEMVFNNSFKIYSEPFEVGAKTYLKNFSNYFDLVFTSPPFFNYEVYTNSNPQYINWYDEFYKPLMLESYRCVKPGGHVCIHISDTSAGKIKNFLEKEVSEFCDLKLIYKIGCEGFQSKKLRDIWVFQKPK